MIAGALIILTAQAAPQCASPLAVLGGGAAVVRESGPVEQAPLYRLGPVESVVAKPQGIQQTAAPSPAIDEPEAGPADAVGQCRATPFQIA